MITKTLRGNIRMIAAFGACSVLTFALAACGSDEATSPSAAPSESSQSQPTDDQVPADNGPSGDVAPGVTGEIAAVTREIAQVQDGSSQTAVTWNDSTTFSARVAGSIDDIAVGACVVASAGFGGGAGSEQADGGAETDEASEPFAATTVQVNDPVDGECTGGFDGFSGSGGGSGGGQPPAGADGEMPQMPDGEAAEGGGSEGNGERPDFQAIMGNIAIGKVISIDGATITVESSLPNGMPGADESSQDTAQDSESTFTVSSDTEVTTTQDATQDSIVAGQCLTAMGEQDDSGTLTATTITVSDPGDEGCISVGRGGMGGGMGGDRPDASTDTNQGA